VVVSLGGGHLLGDGVFVPLIAEPFEVLAFELGELNLIPLVAWLM